MTCISAAGIVGVVPAVSAVSHPVRRHIVPRVAAARDLTDPVSGILPVCPLSESPTQTDISVFVNNAGLEGAPGVTSAGLRDNCALQNWQHDAPPYNVARLGVGKATPDTVSISDRPTTVKFTVDPVDDPGPYNTDLYPCFPAGGYAGGCPQADFYRYYVAVRAANGSGTFSGQWTLIDKDNNPGFGFTQSHCPDQNTQWTPGKFASTGVPCTVVLKFATDQNGAPMLKSALEVIVGLSLDSGTRVDPGSGYTTPVHSFHVTVPMLFTPGASTSLTLKSSAGLVDFGQPVLLTAHAIGPKPGTTITFYNSHDGQSWSRLGGSTTNKNGDATWHATPRRNLLYLAKFDVSGAGAPISSRRLPVQVRPVVTLTGHRSGGQAIFNGHINPTLRVALQRSTKAGWTTEATLTPTRTGAVHTTRSLPFGSTQWRLLYRATTTLHAANSATVTLHRHR
jgi:hypothetical protein